MKYSKEGQDQFALLCNPQKDCKFYLDLGSAHPEDGNNTVRLEEQGWDGLRFDINPHVKNIPTKRTSHLIIGDVGEPGFVLDRLKAFGSHRLINYISFDVDGGTLEALKNFPWSLYRFACMTFEHDSHGRPSVAKSEMMARMNSYGYSLIAEDVCFEDKGLHVFEDWYIDASEVPAAISEWGGLISPGQSWKAVLSILNSKPA